MNPKREHVEAFFVSGISMRTANRDEMNAETAKIPELWERFWADGSVAIPNAPADSPAYGVYADYESDAGGLFDVTAGRRVSEPGDGGNFETVEIQEGDYLVFESSGPMPEVVVDTWKEIWEYFRRHPEVRRAYTTDFEVYRDQEGVTIYIAIEG